MLTLAARAAMRAAGDVEPNPMVGAVLVRKGRIIGIGHHRRFGGPHAEREALRDCERRGESPRGATLYCTLEPCDHHGKQPPCTEAVLGAGIARVVAARADPNPISGGGAARLRAAGIQFEIDESSIAAVRLSEPFAKRIGVGMPYVIAKWAQTIDGRIATRKGDSKWISNVHSRRRVHRLRARVDAIITGLGTVIADDPMLTARGVRRVRRTAHRVVLDSRLRTPMASAIVRSAAEAPTIIVCAASALESVLRLRKKNELQAAGVRVLPVADGPEGLHIEQLLGYLAREEGATNVLVEAGPRLLGSFFEADAVDEAVVHVAPILLADSSARGAAEGREAPRLSDARRFELTRVKRLGNDMELTYRRLTN